MSPSIATWKASGSCISYGPFNQYYLLNKWKRELLQRNAVISPWFSESSFSYSAIVDAMLSIFDRIILFDMLGLG